jgi:hypothetical protein
MENNMTEPQSERQQALSMLKAVHDDQSATLPSGREYKLTKMTHKQRRRVFAFFTKKQKEIQNGDFSFLDSAEFEPVEKVIMDTVLFEDAQLSKSPNHWEEYPEDYVIFITTMLGAISYPFLSGSLGA